MRKLFILLVFISTYTSVYAAEERSLMVGRCEMNIIVAQTPDEHAKGLLGYTERSFRYDGMLFDLRRNGRKYFHTEGMGMAIRMVGVTQMPDGNYDTVGEATLARPGIKSIAIDAPDVFEIPEKLYQLKFRRCLGAKERNQ